MVLCNTSVAGVRVVEFGTNLPVQDLETDMIAVSTTADGDH